MDVLSYILGLIERICKVEGVDDYLFFLDFEVVVLEISRYLFLHSCAIWIKQKECAVIMKVLYCEGHHDIEEFWVECIPSRNL